MSLVAVAPHWRIPGFDGVRQNVREAYEVLELRDALERRYKTDAHLVAYVVSGASRQPRINKPGLPHFGRPVEMGVFFCDLDNRGHFNLIPGFGYGRFLDPLSTIDNRLSFEIGFRNVDRRSFEFGIDIDKRRHTFVPIMSSRRPRIRG